MRLFYIALVLCLKPVAGLAQSTFAGTFLTFGEAIDSVIEPGRALNGCSGFDQNGDGEYYSPDDTQPDGWIRLSKALRSQCQKAENGIGGATLGGAFGGAFSTRTYLPLSINTNRPDAVPTTPPPTNANRPRAAYSAPDVGRRDNGLDGFGGVAEFGGGQLSFGVVGSLVATETTEFGAGQSGEAIDLALSYVREIPGGRRVGLALDLGRESTQSGTIFDFSGTSDVRSQNSSSPTPVQATLDAAQVVCNGLGRAMRDAQSVGLSAYFEQPLTGSSHLIVQGRLGQTRVKARDPFCIYRIGDNLDQDRFFAGIIDGTSRQTRLDLALMLTTRQRMLGGTVVPRIGVAAQIVDAPGYAQTETSAGGQSIIAVDEDMDDGTSLTQVVTTEDTGLALVVEDAFTHSISGEIGATFLWPVPAPQSQGTLSLDVGYVRQFSTDTEVTARFAGDGRETPTTFSFNSAPIDNDYFTVGLGYAMVSESGLFSQINTSALLGDQFEDRYSVGVSFGIVF